MPARTSRPGTFFVTSKTAQGRRIFQVEAKAKLFLDTLQHYRGEGFYKLHTYVVMPDHIHLLLTPERLSIERIVGMIKGSFSHRISSNSPVWQRSFTDHRIRNREEFLIRREYIHQNPVGARLVDEPAAYPYSSAYKPLAQSVPSG